ncbi:MerR family transcriptional regulator [Streptomyces phaeofaciens JCM 4814]|uniref:MerR family transcriptional regulator n=1 Tax=Streptomyces phaeofaciens TaxID=68254 RepID=A0A918M0T0_9ACTN|nr:MerR family transcriptional regulator [Streptomyces phaeofaciens]GGT90224.1 MerR family transcriptional regulator [Streptomyces phaeofaciens]
MDDGTHYSIGELARRTGLTVKTIRFYSDRGIVVPADRTPAGYRRYGPDAVARLTLVRTLRELGLGLDVIRKVVERELTLGDAAEQHAAALEVQITTLRLQRAVLLAAARRRPTHEEMERMHRLAQLSQAERRRLIDGFLDTVFEGLDGGPGRHAAARRSMTPELPDNPTDAQVEAWVQLAELALDPDFRGRMREVTENCSADLSGSGSTPPRPGVVAVARDLAAAAVQSGIAPEAHQADPVVRELTARCARSSGRPGDTEPDLWLLQRLEAVNDPRRDRYFHLLAVINDWPAPQPLTPALDWCVTALRIRAAG